MTYTLETGEYLYRLRCDCCGQMKMRIWGFVSREGDAHAVYYALLNVEEETPRVGLTLSVGPWWGNTDPSERQWVHIETWPDEDGIHMGLRDPQQSNFYPWSRGGVPLIPDEARKSGSIDEFWSVADYIVENDPAVSAYLHGEDVDVKGREARDTDENSSTC